MENQKLYERLTSSDIYRDFSAFVNNPATKIVVVILIVWIAKKFGMVIIKRAVRRSIRADSYSNPKDEKQREDTIVSIIDASLKFFVWVFAGTLILSALGLDIAPLLAGASVIGVALGFGMQSLIKDFVSGIFIIMENQYRVGDWVEVAGVSGGVEAITMRQTVLRDLEGNQHHVPNGQITVATNKSMDFSKVNIKIGVSYDTDIEKAKKVIDQVGDKLKTNPDYSSKIITPPHFVRISDFGASEVTLLIMGKVMPGSQWDVSGEFRLELKKAFDKAKIVIPFQQVVVHKSK